jgi:TetR/AcrR family acrAB operon transcriptional repressor
VAERSGISRGSIPWHFGSKEGLLLAVLEQSVDRLNAGLSDRGAFEAKGLLPLFEQPTTKLFVTLLVEALEPDSPIRDRYAALHDVLRAHCRRWLTRFPLPDGVSIDALATAVVGAGMGVHQQWLVAPDRVDMDGALAALHTLLLGR